MKKFFAKKEAEKNLEPADRAEPAVWKSYRANGCSDAAAFLNENRIDPEFMLPGTVGQIYIFYKS